MGDKRTFVSNGNELTFEIQNYGGMQKIEVTGPRIIDMSIAYNDNKFAINSDGEILFGLKTLETEDQSLKSIRLVYNEGWYLDWDESAEFVKIHLMRNDMFLYEWATLCA
jgi:hypothetical protein